MLTNKALFLDRDGVINIDHGYTYQANKIEFIDGIFDLCQTAQKKGYLIIIVTNQSGIARGYYTRDQFKHLSLWIHKQFSRRGIHIQQTYHCPHHPKINLSCTCRKPRPGMLFKAIRQHKINASQSFMIGDKKSDMQAARKAKIGSPILFTQTITYCSKQLVTKSSTYRTASTLSAIKTLL